MSAKKNRRKFTVEEKAAILRRHIQDKVPVSDLCEEYRLQPSLFYTWQRGAMENLEKALAAGGRQLDRAERQLARENEKLRDKLAKKDNVIAEISEEYVQLKKALGEP